jgi:hypothetical protein
MVYRYSIVQFRWDIGPGSDLFLWVPDPRKKIHDERSERTMMDIYFCVFFVGKIGDAELQSAIM